jgi:ERCC4-type nuclease
MEEGSKGLEEMVTAKSHDLKLCDLIGDSTSHRIQAIFGTLNHMDKPSIESLKSD